MTRLQYARWSGWEIGPQAAFDRVRNIVGMGDDIEDPPGKVHHAQRVLEPAMGGSGIDQRCHRKLMDMAQPLERAGVHDPSLVSIHANEYMDRIPDFMLI